jgi:hypothetical protein
LLVAVVEPLRAKPSLHDSAAKLQGQLAKLALLGFGGFLLISLAFMLLFYSMVGTVFYH